MSLRSRLRLLGPSAIVKHYGPGPHPGTGTPQSIHGRPGRGAGGPVSPPDDHPTIPEHFRYIVADSQGRPTNDLDRKLDHSDTPPQQALDEMIDLGKHHARLQAERHAIQSELHTLNYYPEEQDRRAELVKQRDLYSKEILQVEHEIGQRAPVALPAILERGAEVRASLIDALATVDAPTVRVPDPTILRSFSATELVELVKHGGSGEQVGHAYVMDPRPDLVAKAEKMRDLRLKSEAQYASIFERSHAWEALRNTYFPSRGDDYAFEDRLAIPKKYLNQDGWLSVSPTEIPTSEIHAVQVPVPFQTPDEQGHAYFTRKQQVFNEWVSEHDPDETFAYMRRDQLSYMVADSQDKTRKSMKRLDSQVKKLRNELIADISQAGSSVHAERDALQSVLSTYRDFGGELTLKNTRASKGVQLIRDVEPYLPSDWIQMSNEHPTKLEVKLRSGNRAHYSSGVVQLDGATDTTFHELGHHVETINPVVKRLQLAYWQKRSGSDKIVPIQDVAPEYSHYRRSEVTAPDAWANVYSGKYYDNSPHYEVVSMGMGGYASLTTNLKMIRDGVSYGWSGAASNTGSGVAGGHTQNGNTHFIDQDHMDFMLGILTSA